MIGLGCNDLRSKRKKEFNWTTNIVFKHLVIEFVIAIKWHKHAFKIYAIFGIIAPLVMVRFLGHPVPLPLFLWQLLQSWSSSPNWWIHLCSTYMELEFSKRTNHWSDGKHRTTSWHTWKAQHQPRYEKDRQERWERPREKASSSVVRPSGRD